MTDRRFIQDKKNHESSNKFSISLRVNVEHTLDTY